MQRRADDAGVIAPLGRSDSPESFRLGLRGHSPFGPGRVKLEWEVKPLGELFNGMNTQVSTSWTAAGTGGAYLDERAIGLNDSTLYHWRARLLFEHIQNPFYDRSRWLTPPWNGWEEGDLRTAAALAAGSVADAGAPGQGLSVQPVPGGDLTLSWGSSCNAGDTDYEIYEGALGDFISHTFRYCTTGGQTVKTLTPSPGDRYYLIVPRNSFREGSYGKHSDGSERPQGSLSCLQQATGECQ